MIFVLLVICIVLALGGYFLYKISLRDVGEVVGAIVSVIGGFGGVVSLIVAVVFIAVVPSDAKLDDKIAMYTEENAVIEQQIADCVERYQQYEQGVFDKVSPTDAVSFVTLYPELKSDTLVQAQIETYVENNNKIKALKEKKIDAAVRKWWLYFGG